MERKRQGFFFFRAIYDSVSQLKKREKAIIYEAIFAYALDGQEPEISEWSDTARALWSLAKPMLDSDLRRYENGCKGGAPRGNKNAQKDTENETTEKQPKNNRKQPTILQEQEQEQEINNNSLSISPSFEGDKSERAEASSAEREKIFEIFFLKNFRNPAQEVERFFAHYEAQGWKRGGGVAITDRIALAQSWKPENEKAKHFPEDVAQLIRTWYQAGPTELRKLLTTDLDTVVVDGGTMYCRCSAALRNEIENNQQHLAPSFRAQFPNHRLRYIIPS